MSDLAKKECIPCKGGVPPLEEEKRVELLKQLDNWRVIDSHHLYKEYKFPNFIESLNFVNKISELAEEEAHHPDINFGWGYAKISIWTHKIDNLTQSDFVFAAKIDQIS